MTIKKPNNNWFSWIVPWQERTFPDVLVNNRHSQVIVRNVKDSFPWVRPVHQDQQKLEFLEENLSDLELVCPAGRLTREFELVPALEHHL